MKILSVILLSLMPLFALADNPGGISKAQLDAAITKSEAAEDVKIAANATSITSNTSSISTNTAGRATNTSGISTNGSNITTNTSNISTNTSTVATAQTKANSADTKANANTSGISTNTSNISTNGGNITTNTSNITTNTSNISTNTSNISTNTGSIATNTSNISSNTSSVAAINYLKLDNPDWEALAAAAGVTLANGGIVDCQGASGSLLTSCNKFENFFKDSSIAVRYLFGPSANQITYIKKISLDYSDSDTYMRVENATGTYLGCTIVTPRGKHPTSYGHNSYVTRAHSFNTGANSTFYMLNYPPQGGAQAVDYTFYIICQKVDGTAIGSGEITYFIS